MTMTISISFLLLTISSLAFCFQPNRRVPRGGRPVPRITARADVAVAATGKNGGRGTMTSSDVDEYRNAATAFLSNFMQKSGSSSAVGVDPLSDIDFDRPKIPKLGLEVLAAALDAELCEREWFVTGRVDPAYFDDDFRFQDPDVKLTGIEEYARGVVKIFDQSTSRAQIMSCVVNSTVPNTITVTWRLSGRVNIGPKGLPIKPYVVYTDLTVDETSGLVSFQEDRFDVPGWDILLSALFPFLIGRVTKEPAPEVPARAPKMPVMAAAAGVGTARGGGIFDGLLRQLGI